MASFFNLFLDTIAPSNAKFTINDGALYAGTNKLNLKFSVDDTDTDGYQVKIWGTQDAATETSATWQAYTTTKEVTVDNTDGLKTIHVKIRDAVYNETEALVQSITLETATPLVTITGPDIARISKQDNKNTSAFSFSSNKDIAEWKVMVVQSSGALHDTETNVSIPSTNGSTNMSGTTETAANTPISCSINGTDLETASMGDGIKIVKVFVKDSNGTWSKV